MLKTLISTLLFGFFSTININIYAQAQGCKVLLNGLDEKYSGECKKGLAHGEGEAKGSLGQYAGNFRKGFPSGNGKLTYNRTVVEGSYYEGDWKRGKREGKGTYYYSKDSIVTGFWEDDVYIGKYEYPYKVLSSQALPRYKFEKRNSTSMPSIEIRFKRQGVRTMGDILSLEFQSSSGSEVQLDNSYLIETVDFPFEGRMTLTISNRLKANTYAGNFSFIINETADWIITIDY